MNACFLFHLSTDRFISCALVFFSFHSVCECCNWQILLSMCNNVHFFVCLCVSYLCACVHTCLCVARELNFVWFYFISHRVFANRFNKNEHGCFVNHDKTFGKFLPEHLKDCCFMCWIHFRNLVDSCLLCIFLDPAYAYVFTKKN